jgi:hypothetical protein
VDTGGGELGRLGLAAPQRAAGVDQQLLGIRRGLLGQPCQLTGDPTNHGLGFVAGLRGAGQLRPISRARWPAERLQPRILIRIAPSAAFSRRPAAAIRRTVLASSPESVG